jgi:hypothetical protein
MITYSGKMSNEEIKRTAENHKHLFEFVADCLNDENSIEIYACWAGSENESSKSKNDIIVSEIIKDDFFFNEDELIIRHLS